MLRITKKHCFYNGSDNLAYNQGCYNILQAWNKTYHNPGILGHNVFIVLFSDLIMLIRKTKKEKARKRKRKKKNTIMH